MSERETCDTARLRCLRQARGRRGAGAGQARGRRARNCAVRTTRTPFASLSKCIDDTSLDSPRRLLRTRPTLRMARFSAAFAQLLRALESGALLRFALVNSHRFAERQAQQRASAPSDRGLLNPGAARRQSTPRPAAPAFTSLHRAPLGLRTTRSATAAPPAKNPEEPVHPRPAKSVEPVRGGPTPFRDLRNPPGERSTTHVTRGFLR